MIMKSKKNVISIIKYVYLYLVTFISIVLVLISVIGSVRLVLNEYVFDVKGWDEIEPSYYECTDDFKEVPVLLNNKNGGNVSKPTPSSEGLEACKAKIDRRNKLAHNNGLKQDAVEYLSMLLVALPLYFYHWGLIRKNEK